MKPFIRFPALLTAVAFVFCHQVSEAGPARIATGADSGSGPQVKAFTTRTLTNVGSFDAYASGFTGGVRVAVGDVNGDGGADLITATGPGAAHVKVFVGGGLQETLSFFPYDANTGGVFVAAGDVNGDGFADIVTGADQGAAPHVKVFSGATGLAIQSFFAYPVSFSGGVRVAAGDVNGDGVVVDVVTAAGPGGAPHVKVFHGTTGAEIFSFFAYDVSFSGGVYVAAGDVNGDGRADVITGSGSDVSHVKVFSGTTGEVLQSFFAYPPAASSGGVRVAVGDVDGDGRAEITTVPGPGAASNVRVFNGITLAQHASFFAYDPAFTGGVFIGASSLVRPQLRIDPPIRGAVQLSWPIGFSSQLQASIQLSSPTGWADVSARPTQVGNRMQLAIAASQPAGFFRLRYDEEAAP
jgi:hypothetical protein